MLKAADVLRDLDFVEPALVDGHPLLNWKREVDEGLFPDERSHSGWDRPAARAMLDVAIKHRDDPYCHVLALNILCWSPSPDCIDERFRERYLADAFSRICALADSANEPIIAYWLAGAALNHAHLANPAYQAELQVLAWRLGLEMNTHVAPATTYYMDRFSREHAPSVALARYTVPTQLELIEHLRAVAPGIGVPVLASAEALCHSALAVADADNGQRQGVLLRYHETRRCVSNLIADVGGELVEPDGPDEMGLTWTLDELADPLRIVADALLLVGMRDDALAALAAAAQISPYDGDQEDLAVLGRLLGSANAWSP
jgi:hypothetical protein